MFPGRRFLKYLNGYSIHYARFAPLGNFPANVLLLLSRHMQKECPFTKCLESMLVVSNVLKSLSN